PRGVAHCEIRQRPHAKVGAAEHKYGETTAHSESPSGVSAAGARSSCVDLHLHPCVQHEITREALEGPRHRIGIVDRVEGVGRSRTVSSRSRRGAHAAFAFSALRLYITASGE